MELHFQGLQIVLDYVYGEKVVIDRGNCGIVREAADYLIIPPLLEEIDNFKM